MRPPLHLSNNAFLAQTACIWEATARKAGNVHPGADFANTTYVDFLLSAGLVGAAWQSMTSLDVGLRIATAVELTRKHIRSNTNLGLVLLLAPLSATVNESPIRLELQEILRELTIADAEFAYATIRGAEAGGMREVSEQDVSAKPTVTLLEAMKLAADRDLIARQYANGFAAVFDFGVPHLLQAFDKFQCLEAAIVECHLHWLAEFPDSLIARKNGLPMAETVQKRVQEMFSLGGLETAAGRAAGVELDRFLRSDGNRLNPGTSADLTAACLFVALREGNLTLSLPFRWNVPDWL